MLGSSLAPLCAQIRVVSFNTLGGVRTGSQAVMAALGDESVNGIAKAPDVFSLQEQSSSTTSSYLGLLNSIYGPGTYASTTLFGAGDTTQSFIYNTQTVQLISQKLVGTSSGSGMPRQALRAEFRPMGYDDSADFYVYASHFKSSEGTSEANRRNIEAQTLRADAATLGAANVIYTGDFNVYRSSEAAFQTLIAAGVNQAFDPINRIGTWHDNAAYRDVHTQNPRDSSNQGGMDDRFDWQMTSALLMDNEGLAYINGSYHAFGNTGTHALNGAITSGSAAALAERLPGYTASDAAGVLSAIQSTSDHLPVVADYQLPAKMGVTVTSTPGTVIKGADAHVQFTVANTANVVAAIGADELDYIYYGYGSGLSGSGDGMDNALGGGNKHTLTADTSTAGRRAGSFNVHSSSQSVANGTVIQDVTYTVLDHAQASFSPLGSNTLVLDFGLLDIADGPVSLSAALYNLLTASGYTAGLDFDSSLALGDADAFILNLLPFQALEAGTFRNFTVDFLGAALGHYTAEYQLFFSDEDLPGATDLTPMHLTVQATVVPEPGACWLILLGLIFAVALKKGRLVKRISRAA